MKAFWKMGVALTLFPLMAVGFVVGAAINGVAAGVVAWYHFVVWLSKP